MYYPCSENKGADQLRGYREADLRLCFRIGKIPVLSRCGSIYFIENQKIILYHHLSIIANMVGPTICTEFLFYGPDLFIAM